MKYFFTVLLFAFIGNPTYSQVKTNFTNQNYSKFLDKSSIPVDLLQEGHILVIESPFKEKDVKENKEINEIFKANYSGKFLLMPSDSRDKLDEVGEDMNTYKYSLMIMSSFEDMGGIKHKHYRISIIDNSKVYKGLTRKVAMEKMQAGGKKKKSGNKEYFNSDAIHYTGIEDAHKKLDKMLIFMATILGEAVNR